MKNSVGIIFSKDRAMQLDALLRSFDQYAPEVFRRVFVLYCSSTPEFAAGYEMLFAEYPSECVDVRGVKETSFRHNLLALLSYAKNWEPDYLSFFSDDAILFRPVANIVVPSGALCYSLRLGKNITYSYNADRTQQEGECDFAWKFSNDGHFYSYEGMVVRIHQTAEIVSPGAIEDELNARYGSRSGYVAYGERSSLVCIQHNRVTTMAANRNAGGSAEELNRRFLAGERIDFMAMDFSGVNSPHMELPFVFKRG